MNTAIIVAIIGAVGAVAAAAVAALIQSGDLQAFIKRHDERQEQLARENRERAAKPPPRFVRYLGMAFLLAFLSYLFFFIGSIIAEMCCGPPSALAFDPVPLTGGIIGGIIGFCAAVVIIIKSMKSSRRETPQSN